jgi:hypothetical protein
MKALALVPLALVAIVGLSRTARADIETVDRNGTRWRWVKGDPVWEERLVTVPAHLETREECVAEPGHYETRTKNVWREAGWVWQQQTRVVRPERQLAGPWGTRIVPAETVTEAVRVEVPGHWECVTEQVWCPGRTRMVERSVWVPEACARRWVLCDRPGRWVRVDECPHDPPVCAPGEPRESVCIVPLAPLPVAPCEPADRHPIIKEEVFHVGPDLVPRRRGPDW